MYELRLLIRIKYQTETQNITTNKVYSLIFTKDYFK